MRTYLALPIAAFLSITSLAAPAPLNHPEAGVNSTADDACFSAARDRKPDPSSCDVLLERADADARMLAVTHNNRGLILGAMGLREQALADFEAAIGLAPDLAQARVNRANVLFALARYSEALTGYDEALANMKTNQHVALFNRALTLHALGNLEQAASDLEAARRRGAAQ